MLSKYNLWNLSCILVLVFLHFNSPVLAISCYECESTFPTDSICLPPCSSSYQLNSTCLLTRNIPLDPGYSGSLRANHISKEPIISNAIEKLFVFGEEAVYQNSSEVINWDWEYGPITYGCDTSNCNNPQNINRLPNALNARIPDEILDQYLLGDLNSNCYQCDICLDENNIDTDMSNCAPTYCGNFACNFVATRGSNSSITQCNNGWHFTSGCIRSRELAQVDMTLMYYIRSKTISLYQMAAICRNDNCNNITTFKQLKDAITVDPDLSCLTNDTSSSTITSTSTTTTLTSFATTSFPTTTVLTITSSTTTLTSTATTSTSTATTTSSSSTKEILIGMKLFIVIIFSMNTAIKY